jgi:rubrerythrin
MKEIIPRRAVPVINRVIAEEKSHLQQLSEIKKKLKASG